MRPTQDLALFVLRMMVVLAIWAAISMLVKP